jgi:hypothetical protein
MASDSPAIASTSALPPKFARAAENLRTWRAALPVLEELNRRGIRFIVLKSLPQIEELYGDASGRLTGDVDLVVRSADVRDVIDVARELGWRFKFPTRYRVLSERLGSDGAATMHPWHMQLEQDAHFHEIDLHSDQMEPWRYPPLDAGIWERASLRRQDGVQFLVLAPEDRLLFLCWHAVVEGLVPRKLIDIAHILRQGAELDWDYVAERARSTGTSLFLHLACEFVSARVQEGVYPYWREHVRLKSRARFALFWRTLARADDGLGRRHAHMLAGLGHDQPAVMLPYWRLALLPSRLEVATHTGLMPSWPHYALAIARMYRRRLSGRRRPSFPG